MSRLEKLENFKVYFVIPRTGYTQSYLKTMHEKYLKGELVEGVDYIERQ